MVKWNFITADPPLEKILGPLPVKIHYCLPLEKILPTPMEPNNGKFANAIARFLVTLGWTLVHMLFHFICNSRTTQEPSNRQDGTQMRCKLQQNRTLRNSHTETQNEMLLQGQRNQVDTQGIRGQSSKYYCIVSAIVIMSKYFPEAAPQEHGEN